MLKKLPIGIQTFSQIQEKNYLYIDKTQEALELINSYKYTFLSRPRRFGKSLFLDTLRNIFEGKKALFKDLYIYDKWDWSKTHPVIKISWDGQLRTIEDVKGVALTLFREHQTKFDIVCENQEDVSSCFRELIVEAYKKHNKRVVILIDEYDKPILDVIEDKEQAMEHREFIKGLYSVMKGCDEYIEFAFLTGVSKFSKASIFSGLNMLEDISLIPKFGDICGYTQKDVERTFLPYLEGVDLEKVKVWYNGYNFLKDDVYNPFDLLRFIKNEFHYSNYWFETGTPTFLLKLIEKNNYFLPKLSNLIVDEKLLGSFDVENIDLEVILYQSGYLTIDEMLIDEEEESIEYSLKIPNKEVKVSFSDYIINRILEERNPKQFRMPMRKALKSANLEAFKNSLISIFASIPYNNYTKNSMQHHEGFYATVIYIYLQSLGIEIIGEDVTSRGRIDLTLIVEGNIYILEFKVATNSTNALEQIKAKNYAQKYLLEGKDVYLVGIEFDEQEKNISCFEYEQLT